MTTLMMAHGPAGPLSTDVQTHQPAGQQVGGVAALYLATYVLFGIAVGVLALALHDRLRTDDPVTVRVATLTGLLWSFALVASGLVLTYGMTTIEALGASERAATRQAVEPVALALGVILVGPRQPPVEDRPV